jgi:hypothetical protein
MRNLIILQDLIHEFPVNLTPDLNLNQENKIVDICSITEREELLVLFQNGILVSHNTGKDKYEKLEHEPWDLRNIAGSDVNQWFYVQVIGETGSLICISHAGTICSIQTNRVTDLWNDLPEIEGSVDDGIADALVSPDQTCLVIVTNNNTLLLMTNSFDLINEIPIENRVPDSPCTLSWCGDSMQFALYSVDSADNIPRIRLYNRDLILLNESRTTGDGAGAILRNLLPCMSYAPNGSMIAVGHQKTPKKQQVSFLLFFISHSSTGYPS